MLCGARQLPHWRSCAKVDMRSGQTVHEFRIVDGRLCSCRIDAPGKSRPRLPDSAVTAPTTPVVSATYCTVLSLSSPLIVGIHCGLSGMEEYNFDASLRASCTESVWDDGAGRRSKISRRCCYAVPALAVSGAAGIKYRPCPFSQRKCGAANRPSRPSKCSTMMMPICTRFYLPSRAVL